MTQTNWRSDEPDGIDRRGFLECMAWAGTGVLWTISGGVLSSKTFTQAGAVSAKSDSHPGELHFAQISDSHIGFNKPANPAVAETLQAAIAKINALPVAPAFMLHTGDITHTAAVAQFDTSAQLLKSANVGHVFYVPGEHDVSSDNGKLYRDLHGRNTNGDGWYSFDQNGVHFIGLINVMNFNAGGLGSLGTQQLEWLEKDLKRHRSSTPIVVFAHIPLWMVYPDWGWGTSDSAQALSFLKRFGSVTVLNGHIHQTMQKIEGNVTFHSAASTAFPQPIPSKETAPGPMKVPVDKLREVLGITNVHYLKGHGSLAIIDSSLETASR